MSFFTVTNTFVNSTTADATQVNTNFSDVINATADGTKDFNINALTTGGTTTLSAAVVLGASLSSDLTFNGSVASDINVKTDGTYNIGSSTLGFLSLYLGRNSKRVRLIPSATTSASYTVTLPTTAGTTGYIPYNSDGAATLTWTPGQTGINAPSSADYIVLDGDGYKSILFTTGNSNRICTLPLAANNTGRILVVKKVDTGTGVVTLDGNGSETIDGAVTYKIFGQYEAVTVQCDGTAWYIIDYIPSNWISFTPTGSWSTNVSYIGRWRKNHKNGELFLYLSTSGAPDNTTLTINLPTNFTIDTTAIPTSGDSHSDNFGLVNIYDGVNTENYLGVCTYSSSTIVKFLAPASNAVFRLTTFIDRTHPITWANTDTLNARLVIPLVTT